MATAAPPSTQAEDYEGDYDFDDDFDDNEEDCDSKYFLSRGKRKEKKLFFLIDFF